MGCLFCQIIAGELPCRKIYEDEHTLVIMDVANDVDGHLLVLPKKHCESILDCDKQSNGAVAETIRKVSVHLTAVGYDGVNILNASGRAAGQSVPHLHFHLIPRRCNDGLDTWPKLPGAKEDIDVLHQKLMML